MIYLIECQKDNCKQRYIGETGRILKFRIDEHRGYINNKVISQATGAHYNLPGHSLAEIRVTDLTHITMASTDRNSGGEDFVTLQ